MTVDETTRAKGDPLAEAYVGLALGAPALGMVIFALGVFVGKGHGATVAWTATLVAFSVLILALLLIVPLTNSDRS